MPPKGKVAPLGKNASGKTKVEGKKEGTTNEQNEEKSEDGGRDSKPEEDAPVPEEDNKEKGNNETAEEANEAIVLKKKDVPPPACKKCFVNFAERKSLVCSHEFCAKCWESMVTREAEKEKNGKSTNEGPENVTPAMFKCSVCGASNLYSRPKSAYPMNTIETLEKGVKKLKQFRCMLKRQKIVPDAMVVSSSNEYIFVDTSLKEIIIVGPEGDGIAHFPYLRKHQFQGGLSVDKDGVILVALKNDKFSGVSYYKKTGQFKFSAFLYDDTPHIGSIQSLALNENGSIVVLDSEKMNLCYISKEKLVEVHPIIFKDKKSGFRVDDENNGLEKKLNNTTDIKVGENGTDDKDERKDKDDGQTGETSDDKKPSNGEEKEEGNDIEKPDDRDGKEDVKEDNTHSQDETKNTEDVQEGKKPDENRENAIENQGDEGNTIPNTQETSTENLDKVEDEKLGESPKEDAEVGKEETSRRSGDERDSLTETNDTNPGRITSVALNSWGQMLLCNYDKRCIHVHEKNEHYDSEVGRIDVSKYVVPPVCSSMGTLKCVVDEHDNVILLETFTNSVHRISAEGEYIDTLIKFPYKDTSMKEDGLVYNVVDISCVGKGNIAVLFTREDGEVIVDGDSGEGIWHPGHKKAEVALYSYPTARKFRWKSQKPVCSGLDTEEKALRQPKSVCCTIM